MILGSSPVLSFHHDHDHNRLFPPRCDSPLRVSCSFITQFVLMKTRGRQLTRTENWESFKAHPQAMMACLLPLSWPGLQAVSSQNILSNLRTLTKSWCSAMRNKLIWQQTVFVSVFINLNRSHTNILGLNEAKMWWIQVIFNINKRKCCTC